MALVVEDGQHLRATEKGRSAQALETGQRMRGSPQTGQKSRIGEYLRNPMPTAPWKATGPTAAAHCGSGAPPQAPRTALGLTAAAVDHCGPVAPPSGPARGRPQGLRHNRQMVKAMQFDVDLILRLLS